MLILIILRQYETGIMNYVFIHQRVMNKTYVLREDVHFCHEK